MIHKVHDQLAHLISPLDELVIDPNNAMDHDDRSIAAIAESLDKFGQDLPIIAHEITKVVHVGNGRVEAARLLGWTHAAVLFRSEGELFMLGRGVADNRVAQLSNWNPDNLSKAMAELDAEGQEKIGWMEDELEKIYRPFGDVEIPAEMQAAEASLPEAVADPKAVVDVAVKGPKQLPPGAWKELLVSFDNDEQIAEFGTQIGQALDGSTRSVFYTSRKARGVPTT